MGIAILQSVSEWRRGKEDWSVKNADFAMATSLEG